MDSNIGVKSLIIEFAAGLYYVIAKGNAREDTFVGKDDRIVFLELLH